MSRIQLDGIVDPLHESPSGCTDDVTPAPPPNSSQPDHTQAEQSEEKTNPGPNKYMKVWFN